MLTRPHGCEQPSVAETVTKRVETQKKLELLASTDQCSVSPECDSRRLVPLRSDWSGGSGIPGLSSATHSPGFTSTFAGVRGKSACK